MCLVHLVKTLSGGALVNEDLCRRYQFEYRLIIESRILGSVWSVPARDLCLGSPIPSNIHLLSLELEYCLQRTAERVEKRDLMPGLLLVLWSFW